jgi:predicted GIY-YIG superfamily endonuclease
LKPFFVYMLRCADGSFYVGHTDELERRVAQHQTGEIPGYTHERRPVELVWMQEMATREEALAGELRVKGWSRAKKQALMAGDWDKVSELARSRRPGPASVRPEPVEGLVQGEAGLRQAQPERGEYERG